MDKKPTYKAAAIIEYDSDHMEAPVVSLKGEDHQADSIVQIARKFGIPVVERTEIARTLALADEGTQIPEKLFKAVALVLNELDKVFAKQRGTPEDYRTLKRKSQRE